MKKTFLSLPIIALLLSSQLRGLWANAADGKLDEISVEKINARFRKGDAIDRVINVIGKPRFSSVDADGDGALIYLFPKSRMVFLKNRGRVIGFTIKIRNNGYDSCVPDTEITRLHGAYGRIIANLAPVEERELRALPVKEFLEAMSFPNAPQGMTRQELSVIKNYVQHIADIASSRGQEISLDSDSSLVAFADSMNPKQHLKISEGKAKLRDVLAEFP